MGKKLFIAEKPSVASDFAKILGFLASDLNNKRNGFFENNDYIVTWCVGHLVTMSYPDVYDESLKKWQFETLPFLPEKFLYEVIPSAKNQYKNVSSLLNRADVDTIYICTDSGREGEYIYRLVDQMAKVPDTKKKLRVWIDSQTEEEIKRGIRDAKPMSDYDNLSDSAYLRAKEDYLMGINFSRALSIKYGYWLNQNFNDNKWTSVSVGRVMTCVLGMVVTREWEIRKFEKTPFYRIIAKFDFEGKSYEGEWRAKENSKYLNSPLLYKENGFKKREDALELIEYLKNIEEKACITSIEKKKEKKNPPLLFNLAEIQNLSSKLFKISPNETLSVIQDLYEKKLVTYPRTDARVLSTAVAKEIRKNLYGLKKLAMYGPYINNIIENDLDKGLEKTRYVNDKKITDHYAIIPTGQGLGAINSLSDLHKKMYEVIVRRFLSIFYPPAIYEKVQITSTLQTEPFYTSGKTLIEEGFLAVNQYSFTKKKEEREEDDKKEEDDNISTGLDEIIGFIKKGSQVYLLDCNIKEGETSPPKRYNSGSLILAMENAGQLIEDEELRAQIKGSGIGTSATRAEILEKLQKIGYLKVAKKTQVVTPELKGELVFGIVRYSMPSLLSPKLTASWEKGLTAVAEGSINKEEYMTKLNGFVSKLVLQVKKEDNRRSLDYFYNQAAQWYKKGNNKKKESKKS